MIGLEFKGEYAATLSILHGIWISLDLAPQFIEHEYFYLRIFPAPSKLARNGR